MSVPQVPTRRRGIWTRISLLRWGIGLLLVGILTASLTLPQLEPRTVYEGTIHESDSTSVLGPLYLDRGSFGLYIEDVNGEFDDMRILSFEVENDEGVDTGLVQWEPADYRLREVEGLSSELMIGLDVYDDDDYYIALHEFAHGPWDEPTQVYDGARWFLLERPSSALLFTFAAACICISLGFVLLVVHFVKAWYSKRNGRVSPSSPPGPRG